MTKMRFVLFCFCADVFPYPFDASSAVTPREQRMVGRGVRGVMWIGTIEGQLIE